MIFSELSAAMEWFKAGKPVIVVDALSRENEGDIIFPADCATPEKINFCASHGKGLVCIAIDEKTANRLSLNKLNSNQKDQFHTSFYEPIDAAHHHGTTTGISAFERCITAKLICDENAGKDDFIKPGHLFPIVAKESGVLVRQGHTEAGVDLCKLTGHYPAAIICEIMNDDGSMMRRDDLSVFADKHKLPIISIQQIVEYRMMNENHVSLMSSAQLPTDYGTFQIHVFKNNLNDTEHVVLEKNSNRSNRPIVRIHSECLTGDVFSSLKCDCKYQLEKSMEMIEENENGLIIYMRGHEGRGIGIGNKIAAYAIQENGIDTFKANEMLGMPIDARNYQDAAWILKHFNYQDFDLITNNDEKLNVLINNGLSPKQIQFNAKVTKHNEKYLIDKINIGKHKMILEQ
jgi:3,4-dihydroxy 2-butanone 4-phosphate synthase/GTP cyclohydrolase II